MNYKLIIISAAALCLAGCAKEAAEPQKAAFTIEVNTPSDGVKTCLGEKDGENYPLLWSEGDAISINGIASAALTSTEAGADNASFTFGEAPVAPFSAIYPASAAGADGKVAFPATQAYTNSQFDAAKAVMLGYNASGEGDITMASACGFVKVTIAQAATETLKEIKLYAFGGEPMCGKFTPDYAAGTLTYASDGRNCITISAAGTIPYADGKAAAVIAVPAGTYSEGFAISAVTTDGIQMGKRAYKNTGVTVNAGEMLTMPELTFAEYEGLYSGGAGTEADPYRIATVQDLLDLSAAASATILTDYFIQVADIDMSEVANFVPIGSAHVNSSSLVFKGIYDGNGRIIENLKISNNVDGTGLFGGTDGSTSTLIKNVTLVNATITSSSSTQYVGGIVGDLYGGNIQNCKIIGSSISGDKIVGGISGRTYDATISNCEIDETSTVSGTTQIGGISGGYGSSAKDLYITGCTSRCAVSGTSTYVGGIFGGVGTTINKKSLNITNCHSYGDITGGGNYTGGIMGGALAIATGGSLNITSCSSHGNVTGQKQCVSGILGGAKGIAGTAKMTFTDCTSNGTIKSNSDNYVGGILGYMSCSSNTTEVLNADRCTANGDVYGKAAVGGLFGYVYLSSATSSAVITNCTYNGAHLTSTGTGGSGDYTNSAVGGIVGWIQPYDGSYFMANCVSRVSRIDFTSEPTYFGAGGIFGYNSVHTGDTSPIHIAGCYSTLAFDGLFIDGAAIEDDQLGFGGIGGSYTEGGAANMTIEDCWYNGTKMAGDHINPAASETSESYGSDLTALLNNLNAFVSANPTYHGNTLKAWVAGDGGYPKLSE